MSLAGFTDEVFNHYDDLLDQTLNFTYDLAGNRLEQALDKGNDSDIDERITYEYDENDRLLTESKDTDGDSDIDQTTDYSYTGTEQTGKTVTDETTSTVTTTTTNSYNLQGRLAEVVTETFESGEVVRRETTTFSYDETGIRIFRTNKVEIDDDENPSTPLVVTTHTETTYLSDPNNPTGYSQTFVETTRNVLTQAVTETKVFTIGLDVIAQTKFTPGGASEGTTVILLYDGHGSTRMVADLAAQILERYAYDAYGNAIGFDAATALTALLFSGEWFDSHIQQQMLRNRWYDPTTGRFDRLDPYAGNIRDPQSLHKYLYTHGDPVNFVDPRGLWSSTEILSVLRIGLRVTLLGLSVYGVISNSVSSFTDFQKAHQSFNNGDFWDGVAYCALSVAHAGLAVLSAFGIKAGMMPPPAGFSGGFALVGGSAGAGGAVMAPRYVWQAINLNPAFANWVYTQLVPGIIAYAGNIVLMNASEGVGSSGGSGSDQGGTSEEDHHYASNKHLSKYTREFKKIADKYGLKLNGAWNRRPFSIEFHNTKHPDSISRICSSQHAKGGC